MPDKKLPESFGGVLVSKGGKGGPLPIASLVDLETAIRCVELLNADDEITHVILAPIEIPAVIAGVIRSKEVKEEEGPEVFGPDDHYDPRDEDIAEGSSPEERSRIHRDISSRCEENHCDRCGADGTPVVWHLGSRWCETCFVNGARM